MLKIKVKKCKDSKLYSNITIESLSAPITFKVDGFQIPNDRCLDIIKESIKMEDIITICNSSMQSTDADEKEENNNA